MLNDPRIIHESVAGVLNGMGVTHKRTGVNPPNNMPITEAENDYGKKGKKKKDETDGEPSGKTDDTNPSINTGVNSDDADTGVNVSEEKKDDKPYENKKESDCDDRDDDYSDDDDKDDDKDDDYKKKSQKKKMDEAIAEAFYDNLERDIVFLYENDDFSNALVFGLTESELAPVGGTPPSVPPKYQKKAGSVNTRIDDKGHQALMLQSREKLGSNSDSEKSIVGGGSLVAVGWRMPDRSKGKKVSSGTKG